MEVPRHWRLKKQRYAMVGEICPRCKTPNFPPRAVCPHCSGESRQVLEAREQPVLLLEERVAAVHA
jgi:uncharacterized OB-fold protein